MKRKTKQSKQVKVKKVHDPMRTEANKRKHIEQEKAKQEWFSKNKVIHGNYRKKAREMELAQLVRGEYLTHLSAAERINVTHTQPLTREEYISAGWIKPS